MVVFFKKECTIYIMSHSIKNKSSLVKTTEELELLREGGARLAFVVHTLISEIVPGMSTLDIDTRARQLLAYVGGESSFLNYKPYGVLKAFPAAVCVSVNDEVVHGIPKLTTILQPGDVVTVDCGMKYKKLFTDHAVSCIVGGANSGSEVDRELIRVTDQALMIGIDECVMGNTNLSPGRAIESFVQKRYGIVRELSGHGVGYAVHEDPFVPNFTMKSNKVAREIELVSGMVLAIEPMLNTGSAEVLFLDDEYTVVTRSGKKAAHSEHTIIVTDNGPEIITVMSDRYRG
jgi:methionyl aminopeptidase